MVEIFINNTLVDSYNDVSMPLNFSISDISNPDKRNSSFSKTIKIPSTPTNDALFTHIYEITSIILSTDETVNYTPDFNPNLKAGCEVFIDNMLQFKGSVQLLQINNDKGKIEYECYLLGAIKNIFLDWGELELTDLNLDEFIHDWTYANVVNSWNNAKTISSVDGSITTAANTGTYPIGSGFIYPLIDYGIDSYGNNTGNDPTVFEVRTFFPAFYVKQLIDTMFSEQGYTYTSSFFDSERFKRLILPCNKTTLALTEEVKEERKVKAVNDTEYSTGVLTSPIVESFILPNQTDVAPSLGATDLSDQWDNTKKYITVEKAGSYKLNTAIAIKLNTAITYAGDLSTAYKRAKQVTNVSVGATSFNIGTIGAVNAMRYSIVIYDAATDQTIYDDGNGNLTGDGTGTITSASGTPVDYGSGTSLSATYTFTTPPTAPKLSYFYEYEYHLNIAVYNETWGTSYKGYSATRDVFFDSGDRVYQFNNIKVFPHSGRIATIGVGSSFEMAANGAFVEGSTLYPEVWLPQKIKQKDFFKSILNMFNLYVEQIGEKHLAIAPRVEFYSSAEAKDWTLKLDHSKNVEIKPLGELGANEYLYTYKKDNDLYNTKYTTDNNNEIYGQKLVKIINDFKVKQQKTELIFSPTPLVGSSNLSWKYSRIVKKNEGTGNYEPIDHNIRILYYGGIVQMPSDQKWNIYSISGQPDAGFHEFTKYPYAGHLDNVYQPLFDLSFGKPREVYYNTTIYTDNNLYNIYHKKFIEEITDKDSKILTAYFRLTPQDINELDFRDYIFINGAYYILQKITDYDFNKNEVTKCELLKIKNGAAFVESTIPNTEGGGLTADVETIEGGEDEVRSLAASSVYTLIEGGEDEVRYLSASNDIIVINGSGGADYTVSTILVP